jgi:hypothetical protein
MIICLDLEYDHMTVPFCSSNNESLRNSREGKNTSDSVPFISKASFQNQVFFSFLVSFLQKLYISSFRTLLSFLSSQVIFRHSFKKSQEKSLTIKENQRKAVLRARKKINEYILLKQKRIRELSLTNPSLIEKELKNDLLFNKFGKRLSAITQEKEEDEENSELDNSTLETILGISFHNSVSLTNKSPVPSSPSLSTVSPLNPTHHDRIPSVTQKMIKDDKNPKRSSSLSQRKRSRSPSKGYSTSSTRTNSVAASPRDSVRLPSVFNKKQPFLPLPPSSKRFSFSSHSGLFTSSYDSNVGGDYGVGERRMAGVVAGGGGGGLSSLRNDVSNILSLLEDQIITLKNELEEQKLNYFYSRGGGMNIAFTPYDEEAEEEAAATSNENNLKNRRIRSGVKPLGTASPSSPSATTKRGGNDKLINEENVKFKTELAKMQKKFEEFEKRLRCENDDNSETKAGADTTQVVVNRTGEITQQQLVTQFQELFHEKQQEISSLQSQLSSLVKNKGDRREESENEKDLLSKYQQLEKKLQEEHQRMIQEQLKLHRQIQSLVAEKGQEPERRKEKERSSSFVSTSGGTMLNGILSSFSRTPSKKFVQEIVRSVDDGAEQVKGKESDIEEIREKEAIKDDNEASKKSQRLIASSPKEKKLTPHPPLAASSSVSKKPYLESTSSNNNQQFSRKGLYESSYNNNNDLKNVSLSPVKESTSSSLASPVSSPASGVKKGITKKAAISQERSLSSSLSPPTSPAASPSPRKNKSKSTTENPTVLLTSSTNPNKDISPTNVNIPHHPKAPIVSEALSKDNGEPRPSEKNEAAKEQSLMDSINTTSSQQHSGNPGFWRRAFFGNKPSSQSSSDNDNKSEKKKEVQKSVAVSKRINEKEEILANDESSDSVGSTRKIYVNPEKGLNIGNQSSPPAVIPQRSFDGVDAKEKERTLEEEETERRRERKRENEKEKLQKDEEQKVRAKARAEEEKQQTLCQEQQHQQQQQQQKQLLSETAMKLQRFFSSRYYRQLTAMNSSQFLFRLNTFYSFIETTKNPKYVNFAIHFSNEIVAFLSSASPSTSASFNGLSSSVTETILQDYRFYEFPLKVVSRTESLLSKYDKVDIFFPLSSLSAVIKLIENVLFLLFPMILLRFPSGSNGKEGNFLMSKQPRYSWFEMIKKCFIILKIMYKSQLDRCLHGDESLLPLSSFRSQEVEENQYNNHSVSSFSSSTAVLQMSQQKGRNSLLLSSIPPTREREGRGNIEITKLLVNFFLKGIYLFHSQLMNHVEEEKEKGITRGRKGRNQQSDLNRLEINFDKEKEINRIKDLVTITAMNEPNNENDSQLLLTLREVLIKELSTEQIEVINNKFLFYLLKLMERHYKNYQGNEGTMKKVQTPAQSERKSKNSSKDRNEKETAREWLLWFERDRLFQSIYFINFIFQLIQQLLEIYNEEETRKKKKADVDQEKLNLKNSLNKIDDEHQEKIPSFIGRQITIYFEIFTVLVNNINCQCSSSPVSLFPSNNSAAGLNNSYYYFHLKIHEKLFYYLCLSSPSSEQHWVRQMTTILIKLNINTNVSSPSHSTSAAAAAAVTTQESTDYSQLFQQFFCCNDQMMNIMIKLLFSYYHPYQEELRKINSFNFQLSNDNSSLALAAGNKFSLFLRFFFCCYYNHEGNLLKLVSVGGLIDILINLFESLFTFHQQQRQKLLPTEEEDQSVKMVQQCQEIYEFLYFQLVHCLNVLSYFSSSGHLHSSQQHQQPKMLIQFAVQKVISLVSKYQSLVYPASYVSVDPRSEVMFSIVEEILQNNRRNAVPSIIYSCTSRELEILFECK